MKDAYNKTRSESLGPIRRYESPWHKARGLMLTRKPSYGVHFPFSTPRRVGIHMFFVFYPLDILWLNDGLVVEARTLTPFTIHTPKAPATDVLELPQGTIERTKTRLGDEITLPKGI